MVRRGMVEIKKIEDKSRRNPTFTKRRQGHFKKAKELTTRCGDDVAIITFSLAGNMYAFVHPSVNSVVRRFENTVEYDRVDTDNVVGEDEETENVVEEYEEEEEEETSGEEVDEEVVVKEEEEEEEELTELDELEVVVEDMLKEVSRIAKRMIGKM